ncbi:tRNA threonylcarbamoyladenosine dehydratase [Alkalibacter mobilis]|uniref:tRNA threonylcarbamoyladenosine dehydratase n=1 Tax=Alkalibacter mobilis TaxID=2787712 RepID=UPI0018A0B679|nr:tRNA threonylcarbamoyladenosine dehydratase [Alkalibacter mobilis]MBF7095792.1 tRNA threonylcarbamoyladenosine dehydratase [Alkalibacter mobilis]
MFNEFNRTQMLIGEEALEKLRNSKIAIFGIGGVGSFTAEGLIRAGIENFLLVDADYVCDTNINRQIHATTKTIGKAKVEVMRDRMLEINPRAHIKIIQKFYTSENANEILNEPWDYVIDAIDTVSGKISLVETSKKLDIPIISSMGAGNKLDPTKFEVADIYKTSVCPLAKVMRRELKNRGIKDLKVVYSKEVPLKPLEEMVECKYSHHETDKVQSVIRPKKQTPGSISFVPSVAGLIIAGEVVKDLICP